MNRKMFEKNGNHTERALTHPHTPGKQIFNGHNKMILENKENNSAQMVREKNKQKQ